MWFLSPDHRQLQKLLPRSPHGESFPPNTRLGAQPMNYGIGNSEGIAVKASGSTTGQALHICIASLWWLYLSLWAGVSSGSSAGVSWGLRRGNFKVISAVWLSVRYFSSSGSPPSSPSSSPFFLFHKLSESSSELLQQYGNPKSMLICLVYPGPSPREEESTCFLLHFFSPSLPESLTLRNQTNEVTLITQLLFSLTIYVNMFLQHLHLKKKSQRRQIWS